MPNGRLIRVVSNCRAAVRPPVAAYIVAIQESAKAVDLIRNKVAASNEVVEDLGRVSDELLDTLRVESGKFMRVDKRRLRSFN
jgi:hypothetical protein